MNARNLYSKKENESLGFFRCTHLTLSYTNGASVMHDNVRAQTVYDNKK